jgi:hypothetical protein
MQDFADKKLFLAKPTSIADLEKLSRQLRSGFEI